MNLEGLVDGLKDGSITILDNGHSTNSLLSKLDRVLGNAKDEIVIATNLLKEGKCTDKEIEDHEWSLNFYNRTIGEIPIGRSGLFEVSNYCFNCDADLMPIPIDENTLAYFSKYEYYDYCASKGDKYKYVIKAEDIIPCPALDLVEAKKMVSEIDVPTGELVFANFFRTDAIRTYNEEYSEPDVNSVIGRNRLMQELSEKNVGYGQMGNMSLAVYSNDNEIVLGNDYYEDHIEGHYGDSEEVIEKYKDFDKEIKENGFKNQGTISLEMWRWMCADKSVIDQYGEDLEELDDVITIKVKAGRYRIEHYYDLQGDSSPAYSRITLVEEF